MWADQGSAGYTPHAIAINRAVAESAGFEFHMSNITYFVGRAASWQKVGLIQVLLRGGCENVVWIDADAAFVPGGGERLRDLILQHVAPIMFASNQPWDEAVNGGVQLYRSTDERTVRP
jgi:hypothetical protein